MRRTLALLILAAVLAPGCIVLDGLDGYAVKSDLRLLLGTAPNADPLACEATGARADPVYAPGEPVHVTVVLHDLPASPHANGSLPVRGELALLDFSGYWVNGLHYEQWVRPRDDAACFQLEVAVPPLAETGIYMLTGWATAQGEGRRTEARLEVEEGYEWLPEQEPNDAPGQAVRVEPARVVYGGADANDTDLYRLPSTAGALVVEAVNWTLPLRVEVLAPDGTVTHTVHAGASADAARIVLSDLAPPDGSDVMVRIASDVPARYRLGLTPVAP